MMETQENQSGLEAMAEPLPPLTERELADLVVRTCEETKAQNVLLFDVRENKSTVVTDYYVVCSGTSMPHIRAIAEHVRRALAERGLRPRGIDGEPESRWTVLDYGTVLVHILEPEMRNFYALEELWDETKIIYRSAPAAR